MSLLDEIKSRGYWLVTIRPEKYDAERIQRISLLYPIVQSASVSLRGWDFPHIDSHRAPAILDSWIEQQFDWNHYREIWRLYQSGQFVHLSGLFEDWRDRSSLSPADSGWTPNSALYLTGMVFRFTEIFEFAARLALSDAGDEVMRIEVAVANLKGRNLVDRSFQFLDWRSSAANINEFKHSKSYTRENLAANARDLALVPAVNLLDRFGWNTTVETLRAVQEGLRR